MRSRSQGVLRSLVLAFAMLVAAQMLVALGLFPGSGSDAERSLAQEPSASSESRTPSLPRPTLPTVTVTVTLTVTASASPPPTPSATPPSPTPPPTVTGTPPATPSSTSTPPPSPSPAPAAPATASPPTRNPTAGAGFVVRAQPAAPLAMLAPLCGDGGQTITWSWSAAPDATAYQLQISTSGAQLPDGTLRQADVLNARLDAVTTGYTMAATPGQPYYAVVLPVTPGAGADATRTSRLTEAVCVNPGSGSRPLPPAPSPTAVDNSATPVAAAAPAAPPDAPTNLTATPLDGSEVRLDWVSNSTDEHGFAIDDGYGAVAQVPAGVTTITLVGLDPDGPYCAAVYAFNQAGASALSNFVCFTTLQASDDGGVGSLRITAASRHGGRSGRG